LTSHVDRTEEAMRTTLVNNATDPWYSYTKFRILLKNAAQFISNFQYTEIVLTVLSDFNITVLIKYIFKIFFYHPTGKESPACFILKIL
jgi:hypothetical protein